MNCAVLVGRSLWLPSDDDAGVTVVCDSTSVIAERLSAYAVERKVKKLILIAEPEGIEHQSLDAPRTDRKTFAKLVHNDHRVVNDDTLGWGFQTAWPVSGGSTYKTLLHAETVSVLAPIQQQLEAEAPKTRFVAAWPWYTACEKAANLGTRNNAPIAALLVTENGLSLAVLGPVGAKRAQATSDASARSWEDIRGTLLDLGAQLGDLAGGNRRVKPRILICSLGVMIESVCPFWTDLASSVVIERISSRDLVKAANKIPPSHTSNLLEAFPRPLDLNKGLVALSACAALLAAAGLGMGLVVAREAAARDARMAEQRSMVQREVEQLSANQREAEMLRKLYGEQITPLPSGTLLAIRRISEITPDAITLTRFRLNEDGAFLLEGMQVDEAYPDLTDYRTEINRAGFVVSVDGGWSTNPRREFVAKGICQMGNLKKAVK